MNNYLAILEDLKGKLSAIPEIGVVHDYDRRSASEAEFIKLFLIPGPGGKNLVRGWEISRVSAPESKKGSSYFRHHRFKVAGYRGLVDAEASDKDFQVMVDEVCAVFRAAEPADVATADWYYMDGLYPNRSCVQAETIDQRMFGSVLCHHVDIYITVTERIIA